MLSPNVIIRVPATVSFLKTRINLGTSDISEGGDGVGALKWSNLWLHNIHLHLWRAFASHRLVIFFFLNIWIRIFFIFNKNPNRKRISVNLKNDITLAKVAVVDTKCIYICLIRVLNENSKTCNVSGTSHLKKNI